MLFNGIYSENSGKWFARHGGVVNKKPFIWNAIRGAVCVCAHVCACVNMRPNDNVDYLTEDYHHHRLLIEQFTFRWYFLLTKLWLISFEMSFRRCAFFFFGFFGIVSFFFVCVSRFEWATLFMARKWGKKTTRKKTKKKKRADLLLSFETDIFQLWLVGWWAF